MPKRTDIKRILVIGSGPIVIGQACEFDYSGAQACKVLKEDGYEVVLVNSNPAWPTAPTWSRLPLNSSSASSPKSIPTPCYLLLVAKRA